MGLATLGDWRFRVDPNDVQWDFSVKTAVHRTIGGKVVQVLGVQMGDIRVTGHFGRGGTTEQARFLDWFREVAKRQAASPQGFPIQFAVPQRNWRFDVTLKSYTEGQRSIKLDVGNFSPTYTLTLFPNRDLSAIKVADAAMGSFIARISRDFGWQRTSYNGPMTFDEVEATLSGRNIETYLSESYSPTTGGGS